MDFSVISTVQVWQQTQSPNRMSTRHSSLHFLLLSSPGLTAQTEASANLEAQQKARRAAAHRGRVLACQHVGGTAYPQHTGTRIHAHSPLNWGAEVSNHNGGLCIGQKARPLLIPSLTLIIKWPGKEMILSPCLLSKGTIYVELGKVYLITKWLLVVNDTKENAPSQFYVNKRFYVRTSFITTGWGEGQ